MSKNEYLGFESRILSSHFEFIVGTMGYGQNTMTLLLFFLRLVGGNTKHLKKRESIPWWESCWSSKTARRNQVLRQRVELYKKAWGK